MKRFILLVICIAFLFISCNKDNKKQDNNLTLEQTENDAIINNSNDIHKDFIEENDIYKIFIEQPLDTPINIIKNYIKNNLNLTITDISIEELLTLTNIDEINKILLINENKKNTQYNTPVKNIQETIFKELNLKYELKTKEEILSALNLVDKYSITESEEEFNFTGGGIMEVSLIEWNLYKLNIYKVKGYEGYRFDYLNIEINNSNYKYLFPYLLMEEYLSDNNFGELYYLDENSIQYAISEENEGWQWFFKLFFNNNILKEIWITPFIP